MTTDALVVLDIGGTSVRVGHLLDGRPHPHLTTYSTDALRGDEPLGFLEEAIRAHVRDHGLRLGAVVLGVPFTPDPAMDTALSSPNIRSLEGVPIGTSLAKRLGVPVRLERDINLLLLGEWHAGAARGVRDVFGMFIGTGIGGCFLQGGVPYRGATGAAVELGHVPIRADGRRCVCGNIDCLEAYACGRVLEQIAADHDLDIGRVFLDGPGSSAHDDLSAFTRDLAYGLSTAVNLFHPELALVGGGIPAMDGFPRETFRAIFYDHLRRPIPSTTVALAWGDLGSLAALHGAAVLP